MSARVVQSFLTPAYWGSFLALGFNLFLMIVFVYGGIDVGEQKKPEGAGSVWNYVYIASVVLVFIFVIRYYSSVALQTYIGDESKLLKAPKQMKIMLFLVFTLLIFFSSLNTFFIGYPLLLPALFVCLLQTLLSLLCVFSIEVWRWFRPDQIPKSNRNYFISEFMFGCMVYFLILMVMNTPIETEQASYIKLPIGGIIAWAVILTLHEWLRLYGKKMYEQAQALWATLAS